MLKKIAQGKGLKVEKKLNDEELDAAKGGRMQDWGCGSCDCSNCGTRSGSAAAIDYNYGYWFWQ